MRAALTALALAALLGAGLARAGTPLALAERQVTALEFDRPVSRLAVTDPDVLRLEAAGARVKVTALRAGRTSLEVTFDDGAVVAFDAVVEAARRPAARAPAAPGMIELLVGEQRRVPAPGLARALIEENGTARARAEAGAVVVTGLAPGTASLLLVDGAGARTSLSVQVR